MNSLTTAYRPPAPVKVGSNPARTFGYADGKARQDKINDDIDKAVNPRYFTYKPGTVPPFKIGG